MTREFIILPEFDRCWLNLGLADEELADLQQQLCINPKICDVMEGTGGLRKMRYAYSGRSKSRNARVAYVDFSIYEKIYLIAAFSKSEQSNLTKAQCNNIKSVIKLLISTLRKKMF
jgi:hypothetical protein